MVETGIPPVSRTLLKTLILGQEECHGKVVGQCCVPLGAVSESLAHIAVLRSGLVNLLGVALLVTLACRPDAGAEHYTIVQRFPHDTAAYTQGLVHAGGDSIYESTGRYGRSELRVVRLSSGQVIRAVPLPADRFGEGLALLNDKLYQLSWKSGVGYVYHAGTLQLVDSFPYAGEGWGLTSDGSSLILGDGTAKLRFLSPGDFGVSREITVRDHGSPLSQLNELEFVNGVLLANVYQSDWIVSIDPTTGNVLSWLNFAGLLRPRDRTNTTDVLNGIAFDTTTGNLFVTGKLWPALFEVRLTEPDGH